MKKKKTTKTSVDYDNPWKEVLDVFFPQFMEFFYPQAYVEIDWSKGYISLDKELQKIVRDANLGKRLADKLVRVTLKNGKKAIIIIHIEIQSEYESNFEARMFVYHYRIYDKYKKDNVEIVSLAVLGDDSETWRPTEYKYSRWGCKMEFEFPIINMYEKGYDRDTVLQLFRLLDWMMILPAELTKKFDTEISDYEEENKMPYITSVERLAIARGREQGREEGQEEGRKKGQEEGSLSALRQSILQVLEVRFQSVPTQVSDRLNSISSLPMLQELLRLSVTISSIDHFIDLLSYHLTN